MEILAKMQQQAIAYQVLYKIWLNGKCIVSHRFYDTWKHNEMAAISRQHLKKCLLEWTHFNLILIPLKLVPKVLTDSKSVSTRKWLSGKLATYYCDVIMGMNASQITSLTVVYSTLYSGADQRKHKSSASLAFVRGIHRRPVNSPQKWPATQKMFPFDDVIMSLSHKALMTQFTRSNRF